MAKTYTWIGPSGSAAAGTIAADWSPSGGPPAIGDSEIIGLNGTVLAGDGPLKSNTVVLAGGRISFAGDSLVAFGTPSIDSASLITTATTPSSVTASTVDALGNFLNQGSILAAGAAGSSLTINVGTTVINGVTVAGYAYNTGLIEATAGNTLTVAIAAASELLNTGSIVADGGTVRITASPSAIAGGAAPVRGEWLVEGGGTLETGAAYAATVTGNDPIYYFADSATGNTLKIDNLGSFGGRITGFSAGDTIDLGSSLAVGTLAYSTATNILNLESNGGVILASLLIASGAFASGTFAVNNGTADGFVLGSVVANGTTDTVLTTTLVTPVASGTSGTWQTAASWANGRIPGASDTPLIGQGTSAGFTLTTGSAPLSVAGFTITDPQATVTITSNVTATPDGIANKAGTLEVTASNTVSAASLSLTEPSARITIDTGATVSLTGHQNIAIAAIAGILSPNIGDTYGVNVSAGLLTVNGTLLAAPAPSGGGGGSTTIGYDGSGQPATVVVNAGAKVTDSRTTLGSDPTSAGSLTISGSGATWTDAIDPTDTARNTGFMEVGYNDVSSDTPAGFAGPTAFAAAQLLVTQGATLTDQEGGFIAESPNSSGTVTVSTGGLWNIANNGTGFLTLGQAGAGVLSVLNGGSVAVGNVGTFYNNGTTFVAGGIGIGNSIGATGTLNVNGAGSEVSTSDGISIGRGGQGAVVIQNGGTVLVTGSGIGIGQTAAAGASGTIIVGGTGAAALLSLGSLSTGMTVGNAAPGTVVVGTGGTISLSGTNGIGFGHTAGASGLMTVSGGLVTEGPTNEGIGIGQAAGAPGTLQVLNGGTVSIAGGNIGVGVTAAGSSGTITVQGAGSLIRTTGTGTSGAIFVGAEGGGLLMVGNGGSVSLGGGLDIGTSAGGAGTVTVNGGTITAASLAIDAAPSQAATGALTIGASGAVDLAGAATVNNNGAVTLAGGVLNLATGAALSVAVGGQVSGYGQVVDHGGLKNAGTVTASGGGLELSVGAGAMSIAPGGTLTLDGGLASGASVAFAASGLLALGNASVTGGAISGFGAGDTISLAGINVTGSSYANGVLTLADTVGAVNLNVTGNFALADLGITNTAGGAQVSLPGTGVLGDLNVGQQLELIYVAYFDRAADGAGFGFWNGQNVSAQNGGQSAAAALTNIANSFAPQPETVALYPFLSPLVSGGTIDLTTPAAQAGLSAFIGSVYENLFNRAADSAGQNYWVGQITTGAVGLGAAALAIANGATSFDAIELQNKVAVALDFTTRTNAAGLGATDPLPSSFLPAARSVLTGVDGTSLNDASVTAGMAATTTYIDSAATSQTSELATNTTDPIVVTTPNLVIDPGSGSHTIQFLGGASGDTLVLHTGGVDQVSGFDPSTDVLDLRSLLAEGNVDLHGNIAALGNYLTVVDQGADALVRFDPSGQGGGPTIAVLHGLGYVVTGLETLVAQGAVRIE